MKNHSLATLFLLACGVSAAAIARAEAPGLVQPRSVRVPLFQP